ncbi:GNAT family N-acetyltransferase [Cellulomonas sp. P22]|uniref:GNAT family N-acetyltransferase n=1 Tax=Cellulomonas sp. P22 TaxID=3373189 RepID=UPI00378D0098
MVGVGLDLFFAVMIRDYALVWMVLLPTGLWALEDGQPVGAAVTVLSDDVPLVAFLFTVPDAVGRGVATRLVGRVCQALAADGYDSVALWVSVANERAARLFRHLGFVDMP